MTLSAHDFTDNVLNENIAMACYQSQIQLSAFPRGLHLITEEVEKGLPELADVRAGLLHVFILHTSASLTINENADPDVPFDMESSLNAIAPEDFPYRHSREGPDDMPAQTHTSMANIATVLGLLDAELDDIVKVGAFYSAGCGAEALHANLQIRSDSFTEPGPASTGIPLSYLAYPGMVVEFEVLAMTEPEESS